MAMMVPPTINEEPRAIFGVTSLLFTNCDATQSRGSLCAHTERGAHRGAELHEFCCCRRLRLPLRHGAYSLVRRGSAAHPGEQQVGDELHRLEWR